MKYTDIAWDFDGTLFDSYPNCVRAFGEMLKSFGYEETEEAMKEKMIVTLRNAMSFFSEKYGLEVQEMRRRYKEIEGFRPDLVRPYPEVPEILRKIKESGRRNHLYTNRNHDAIRYLDAYHLTEYFDGLITSEEQEKMKPDPSGIFLLKERYQIEPGKLLMIGDRVLDMVPVKPAGFDGCFYNTSHLPVPECADMTLDSLENLMEYL